MKTRKSNRLLDAAYLAMDGAVSGIIRRNKPHILLACMPKSGSTFLATALAEYPGFQKLDLVPAWGHREQELCPIRLSRYNRLSYIAQLHLRNSDWTQHLIAQYGMTPIVLVRNLTDAVVSLRDHLRKDSAGTPLAYFTEHHLGMNDADFEEAIVRLAMPWYVNFYAGWRADPNALILNYDDMIVDPAGAMITVFERANVTALRRPVEQALERVKDKKIRFNVGIAGRGRALSPRAGKALLDLLDCYPKFQTDTLFIQTRQALTTSKAAVTN